MSRANHRSARQRVFVFAGRRSAAACLSRMWRVKHTISTPSLRALSRSTAAPSRSLVSTVLLTNEGYDTKQVTELRALLRQRGLTTSGRKAELVQRLKQSDMTRAGSTLANADKAPQSRAKKGRQAVQDLEEKQPSLPMEPGTVVSATAVRQGQGAGTSSSSPQATPKSGWIRAQRSTSATPVKTGRDECVLFPWQQDLDAHLPKYRKLAHMSPARTLPTTPPPRRYRAPLRLEPGSARVERKADTFAMVKEVWRGAMDTPSAATPAPARKPETRQAQQTTLDAFTRPTTKTTHVPESRALPPSPPDSLSSCSTIPGDSDDEIASPARTWIRALGSSPSEWLHSSP